MMSLLKPAVSHSCPHHSCFKQVILGYPFTPFDPGYFWCYVVFCHASACALELPATELAPLP